MFESIEYRVDDAELQPKRIAVGATLFLLVSVKSFEANAETFTNLPDQVQAGVMGDVVSVRALRELVIQFYVTVTRGRTEIIVPLVRETDHGTKCRDRCELSRSIESSIVIHEVVIEVAEESLPIGQLRLNRIVLSNVELV